MKFVQAASALLLAVGLIGAQPAQPAQAYWPGPTVKPDPRFAPTSYVNPFGLGSVGAYASPRFVDIDGDGDLDAFSGSSSSIIGFRPNTGTAITPTFGAISSNPFGLSVVATYVVPTFVDIDADGDFDMFAGASDGSIYFQTNIGTVLTPTFGTTFLLFAVSAYAIPTFADIDRDGDFDMFIGTDAGDLLFRHNAGNAEVAAFDPVATNPFGLSSVGAAAPHFVDFDGDGDLDAFVGSSSGESVFFRNTGTAIAPAFAPSSANAFALADVGGYAVPTFADIDRDGDLDAFVGNAVGDVRLFRNAGAPRDPSFVSTSTNPFGLADIGGVAKPAFGDLDGDGDLDALVGTQAGSIIFFRNAGGAFAPAFTTSSSNPFGLASVAGGYSAPTFADIDGDGDLDVFVGDFAGSTSHFRNTGTVAAPAFLLVGVNANGMADVGARAKPTFADIDADGDLDAFVGNNDGNTLYFHNTGSVASPSFASAVVNPFGLSDVSDVASPAFADVDGDGDLDALVGDVYGNTHFYRNSGSLSSPAFAPSSANPFGLADVGIAATPTLADIDGDGDLDAFVGEVFGNTVFFRNVPPPWVPAPAFAATSTNPFGLADVGQYSAPAFADIDGDGDLDAFVGRRYGSTIFFRNTGSAIAPAFSTSSVNPFGLVDVGSLATPAFADIDGDGDLDAFVGKNTGGTGYVVFFSNTGSAIAPAFSSSSALALTGLNATAAPAFVDIDGDGDLDAFVEGTTYVRYYRNSGSAIVPAFTFVSNAIPMMSFGLRPAFYDVDGDGDLDVMIGGYPGYTGLISNTGTALVHAFPASSANPFGLVDVGKSSAPSFADIDGDGDLDAFVGESDGNLIFFRNFMNTPTVFVPSTSRTTSSGW